MQLSRVLQAWGSEAFVVVLKDEIENLPAGELPLQLAANEGGYIDDSNLTVTIITVDDTDSVIQARLGIFFTEVVANCSCGDEPMEKPAYCEILLRIDKSTATTDVTVLGD